MCNTTATTADNTRANARRHNEPMQVVDVDDLMDVAAASKATTTETTDATETDASSSSSSSSDELQAPVVARPGRARSVSFGVIEFRTYHQVKGSPELNMMHPLSLDWNVLKAEQVDLDDYEGTKPPRVHHFEELKLTDIERKQILKQAAKNKPKKERRSSLPSSIMRMFQSSRVKV